MNIRGKGMYGMLALALVALSAVFAFVSFTQAGLLLAVVGLALVFGAVSMKEREGFLLATAVLAIVAGTAVVSGFFNSVPGLGSFMTAFLGNVLAAFAPAAVLLAVWHVYDVTKSK